ncbi:uncharacterized protein MYCFIDRAFT_180704 [Pseudocercospora fijiensis CIRAD86]|uniref:Uncharacterized protein n=1 Tax=Pseudocercospora fijiensis (strain CIRAD86) TaxID=383855 RepID=M2ZXJ1_PSEFD|nr:uncharacterized protein MYCFIDRAFT_180704 [Pseudocercospora fijiensis CIRAD86]EME76801.1 hypothetical protein MYCFIDRAFT_180704 [Pseudocercospora fijiensis CIRAD86]
MYIVHLSGCTSVHRVSEKEAEKIDKKKTEARRVVFAARSHRLFFAALGALFMNVIQEVTRARISGVLQRLKFKAQFKSVHRTFNQAHAIHLNTCILYTWLLEMRSHWCCLDSRMKSAAPEILLVLVSTGHSVICYDGSRFHSSADHGCTDGLFGSIHVLVSFCHLGEPGNDVAQNLDGFCCTSEAGDDQRNVAARWYSIDFLTKPGFFGNPSSEGHFRQEDELSHRQHPNEIASEKSEITVKALPVAKFPPNKTQTSKSTEESLSDSLARCNYLYPTLDLGLKYMPTALKDTIWPCSNQLHTQQGHFPQVSAQGLHLCPTPTQGWVDKVATSSNTVLADLMMPKNPEIVVSTSASSKEENDICGELRTSETLKYGRCRRNGCTCQGDYPQESICIDGSSWDQAMLRRLLKWDEERLKRCDMKQSGMCWERMSLCAIAVDALMVTLWHRLAWECKGKMMVCGYEIDAELTKWVDLLHIVLPMTAFAKLTPARLQAVVPSVRYVCACALCLCMIVVMYAFLPMPLPWPQDDQST